MGYTQKRLKIEFEMSKRYLQKAHFGDEERYLSANIRDKDLSRALMLQYRVVCMFMFNLIVKYLNSDKKCY